MMQYLSLKLYTSADSDLEECLPQLLILMIATNREDSSTWNMLSRKLEEYIITKCSMNIHLGLKFYWLLDSIYQTIYLIY